MPRPRKGRRVCYMPERVLFGPIGEGDFERDSINMTVEEYETIRLIDYENLTQEECSLRMNVARTTVQRIYNDARKKLAESLIDGRVIRIQGGDFVLCNIKEPGYGCGMCKRNRFGRGGAEQA